MGPSPVGASAPPIHALHEIPHNQFALERNQAGAILHWSNWIVPLPWDEGEAHLHRPFDNPHDAENTARMGDKAKPSGVSASADGFAVLRALPFKDQPKDRRVQIRHSV
jgi:hypothetical protein